MGCFFISLVSDLLFDGFAKEQHDDLGMTVLLGMCDGP